MGQGCRFGPPKPGIVQEETRVSNPLPSSTEAASAGDSPARRTFTLLPVEGGEFTRTGMWLMMGGCCLSLPLALVVLALTGTSLVDSRPAFIAIFVVAALGLATIGLTKHLAATRRAHHC